MQNPLYPGRDTHMLIAANSEKKRSGMSLVAQTVPAQAGFFDFVTTLPNYAEKNLPAARMNKRHRFIIDPFRDEIAGARVLDLAAHDGRWAYAFAGAGAASVLGIEGRQDLIDMYAAFPETDFKGRVTLRQGDIFAGMEAEIAAGNSFDVIGVLGIYYHIMDHFRLLQLARRLNPKLVIIDGAFIKRDGMAIQLLFERTDKVLNAIPQREGQERALKGVPTFRAMEAMAEAAGFALTWCDWASLAPGDRDGVQDYFRVERTGRDLVRGTCALRPV